MFWYLPSSTANARVNPVTADFVALYAAFPGPVTKCSVLAILTMRAASLFNRAGTQARMKIARAVRLMSTVLSQRVSNDVSSSKAPPPTEIPALFIRICLLLCQTGCSGCKRRTTYVKAAERFNDLLTNLLDPATICHIADPALRTSGMNSIDFVDDGFHFVFLQVEDSDSNSFISEHFSSLSSHARSSPRHDRNSALK